MVLSGKHKLQSDVEVWLKLYFMRGEKEATKQNEKTDSTEFRESAEQ